MDVNKSPAAAKALETQLASARQQMMGLVTEAAKAGAVMENDLKKKLNSASKASDELTEEIIKQRKLSVILRMMSDDCLMNIQRWVSILLIQKLNWLN